MWYLFHLLCSHRYEGGNALRTLLSRVDDPRLQDLLRAEPPGLKPLSARGRLRAGGVWSRGSASSSGRTIIRPTWNARFGAAGVDLATRGEEFA